jgi:drug/metabolite transporter (DMT)-like permease
MVQKWKIILAFAVIYLVWGTTYLAILFAIKDIPPLLMSGMRFLFAGIILYLFCLAKKEELPDFSSLIRNMVQGLLMLVGGIVSVTIAEQYLSSSTAAIIVTAVPFYFILLDHKHWKSNFSNKILLSGLIIGFIGVALLMTFSKADFSTIGNSSGRIIGILIIIAGGVMWTTGSLISKYKPAGSSILMNTSVQLSVAGFFCLCASLFSGEIKHFSFSQVHLNAWLSLGYLVTFGSTLAYVCYLWLLKIKPAAQVSSYVYVNPVVAVIVGGIIGKETISKWHIFSLAIILCGVLLINLPKYKLQKTKRLSIG